MALIITNFPGVSSYVPFERPPQDLTLWSAIPRGIQSFIVNLGVNPIKLFDNQMIIQLQATLPPNFGYVMIDASLQMIGDQAIQWDPICNLNLQNFYRASQDLSLAMSTDWPQDFLLNAQDVGRRQLVRRQPWPSYPIIGTQGTSGILVNLSAFTNDASAQNPGFVNGYISFWQFDLEQIRKFPINTPVPTHAR